MMRTIRAWLMRLSGSFNRRRRDRELADELLAYTVTRQTHEIGVRTALGAGRADVMQAVLRDALWMVCAGLALGAPLAFWGSRVTASLVPNLPANGPFSIVFGSALMVVLGLAAAYIPARRAMRVDPMTALRYE